MARGRAAPKSGEKRLYLLSSGSRSQRRRRGLNGKMSRKLNLDETRRTTTTIQEKRGCIKQNRKDFE